MALRLTVQVQLVVQALLRDPAREMYGLELSEETGLQPGTAYPILLRLEHEGWLASRWEDIDPRAEKRPTTGTSLKTLIVRMARENPAWGHRRIQGELARPGHVIAASAVREILLAAGIDPAPRRAGPAWRQFLAAQAHAIIARDVLVVETVLLKRLHVLVFTGHGTRGLHLAGVTAHPTGAWAETPRMNAICERVIGTLRRLRIRVAV